MTPRLSNAVALLALLAERRSDPVPRTTLLTALFDPDSPDLAAYLRQTVRTLRQVLPHDLVPTTGHDSAVRPAGGLGSDSVTVRRHLAAARSTGRRRADSLRAAIALLDLGPYLPTCTGPWVEQRRRETDLQLDDALLDLATTEHDLDRHLDADHADQAPAPRPLPRDRLAARDARRRRTRRHQRRPAPLPPGLYRTRRAGHRTSTHHPSPPGRRWPTRAELRVAIISWIETTYHRRRRQVALGRLTPIEFETLLNTAHAA